MPSLIAVDPTTVAFEPNAEAISAGAARPHRLRLHNPVWASFSLSRGAKHLADDCRLAADVKLGDFSCAVGSRVTLKKMYRAEAGGMTWPLARVTVEGAQPIETFAAVDQTDGLLPPAEELLTLTPVADGEPVWSQYRSQGIAASTLVPTINGLCPAKELHAGDRLLTRDYGLRTLRWVGQSYEQAGGAGVRPPILIAAGALGNGLPQADVLVAPRQKVLVASGRAELLFGEAEVLVFAEDLLGMPGISEAKCDGATYVQLVFDSPELFMSDGLWLESSYPGSSAQTSAPRVSDMLDATRMTLMSTEASTLLHS